MAKRGTSLPVLSPGIAELWLPRLEPALAEASRNVRDALPLFLQLLATHNPQLLHLEQRAKRPAASIRQAAGWLYAQAASADELNCYQAALRALWGYYTAQGLDLDAPAAWMPLPPEPALLGDENLPLGLVESLVEGLLRPVQLQIDLRVLLGRWLLLVAWETGRGELALLDEVLAAEAGDWTRLGQPAALTLWLAERQQRLWLGALGALLGGYLQRQRPWPKLSPRQLIQAWLDDWLRQSEAPAWLGNRLQGLRVERLVRDISLLHRPLALQTIWSEQVALAPAVLLRNWSGHYSPLVTDDAAQEQRRHLPLAGNGSQDKAALSEVRAALRCFQISEPRQVRNTRAAQECRQSMEAAIDRPLSSGLWLLLRWTLRMFTHGTPWCHRLAVGTLLTYLSHVSTFLRLSFGTADPRSLDPAVLTAECQEGLDLMATAESQRTVLRFLLYAQSYPDFPPLELNDLQLLTREGRVRANYVAPGDFDACCAAFTARGGAAEQQMVLFAQLCYHAGLREDEARSLQCNEINPHTGLLYISARQRRKSAHAIRKVPLALLPDSVQAALRRQIAEQQILHARADAPLFSGWDYAQLEAQWLDMLRSRLQDGSLVTHSLRHSAANNWLCRLAMLCCDWQPARRPRWLQHPLFDEPSLNALRRTLTAAGARLDAYFPVLDWISQTLGHSSPAISLTCYVHWLDWLAPQLWAEDALIRKDELRRWVAGDSLYGFELQKVVLRPLAKSFASLSTLASVQPRRWSPREFGYLDTSAALEWAVAHWPGDPPVAGRPASVAKDVPGVKPLPFSRFHRSLALMLAGADDSLCPVCIHGWLDTLDEPMEPLAPQLLAQPAWQRLCHLVDTSASGWSHLEWDGLTLIADKLARDEAVTTLRDLGRYCHGLRALGLPVEQLVVQFRQQGQRGAGQGPKWQAVLKRHGLRWYPEMLPSVGLTVLLRPYRLRWPLWSHLPGILRWLSYYRAYLAHASIAVRV